MESSIKDKYIILGFVGFAIVLISSIATLVIADSFNQDNFVRWIVFVCCNLLGWLLYLSFQTLIFDTYEIYKIKFGKKETIAEAIEVQEELSQNTLEEATSVPGPTSVPEPVPESSPTKEETLIQTQPIELTIAPDLHEKNRANYASREQREKEERIRMVMEYCHYYLPRIADQETVNHICTEVDKWMNLLTLIPRSPYKDRLPKTSTTFHSVTSYGISLSVSCTRDTTMGITVPSSSKPFSRNRLLIQTYQPSRISR